MFTRNFEYYIYINIYIYIYKCDGIFDNPACSFCHEVLSVFLQPLQQRDDSAQLFSV